MKELREKLREKQEERTKLTEMRSPDQHPNSFFRSNLKRGL